MKYFLVNPTFSDEKIEISSVQAVKQIDAYINKPISLGDEIFIVVQGIPTKLQFINKEGNIAEFKQIKLRGI